jgi:hypothetical protein
MAILASDEVAKEGGARVVLQPGNKKIKLLMWPATNKKMYPYNRLKRE